MRHGAITFSVLTLGCKLNQYESMGIREAFENKGWSYTVPESGADWYIVNTCTVTGKTDRRSRHAIRRIHSWNPVAKIIVTGCGAERKPSEFTDLPNVVLVAGNRDKFRIPTLVDDLIDSGDAVTFHTPMTNAPFERIPIRCFSGYTRAFLKIQEGCPRQCSYCIIPSVRGSSRSQVVAAVLEEAAGIAASGFHEIVLTGIDIGSFGLDLQPRTNLIELLPQLLKISGLGRIRLSSIEPTDLLEPLGEFMTSERRICRHLHIPLQSGSDTVLERMNRHYLTSQYGDWIIGLKKRLPDLCIGSDIIAAFPGETETEFEAAYQFIQEIPIDYLHVFTYSPREGTPAACFSDHVHPETARLRCHRLRTLGREKAIRFRQELTGRTVEVIMLSQRDEKTGYRIGLAGNYVKVAVPDPSPEPGSICEVFIQHREDLICYGRIIS